MTSTASAVHFPALEALLDAYHQRQNGRLVFRRDGAERSVILLFRTLLFVNSTDKKDRLELLLATRKLMGKEEILRIARKARDKNLDFMTMVQREGALKDVALVDLMQDRAKEILAELVTWSDAEIKFDPYGFRAEPVLPFNLKLIPILAEGLTVHLSIDECRRILGSEDTVLESAGREHLAAEFSAAPQGDMIRTILSQVDGRKSIVDILQATESEGLQVLKVLTSLLLIGAVQFPRAQAESMPEVAPADPVGDAPQDMASVQLSQEERDALSNIFDGAENLLDEGPDEDDALEIVEADDESYEERQRSSYEEDGPDSDETYDELADLDPVEADDDSDGESTQVRNDFNALLDIDPEEAANLFAVGLELMQRGRVVAALASYQEAIEKDPSNPEYYSSLGLAHLEEHPDSPADDAAALRAFLEAAKLDPAIPKNHFYIGKIHERRGDRDEAISSYEEACRQDSSYTPARQALDALQGGAGGDDDKAGFLRRIFGR